MIGKASGSVLFCSVLFCSVLFCSVLFCSVLAICDGLMAQAPPTWAPPFDHRNLNGAPGEVEQPPVPRTDWITLNTINGRDLTNPLPIDEKFNALHASLIPVGPHRGNVLVVDGNLRDYSIPSASQPLQRIRAKQPWAIVNPYWPNVHPYTGAVGHRFYNRTLTLPIVGGVNQGELFCGGHAWMPNGRLFWAGGTKRFPTSHSTNDFIGSQLVWMFDPQLVAWHRQQQDLAVERWYPSVTYDGSLQPTCRAIITGGTNPSLGGVFCGSGGILDHYESYSIPFFANPPSSTFEQKNLPGPTGNVRLYDGIPGVYANSPGCSRNLTDYPRVHLLTTGQFFVSGFEAEGAIFTHIPTTDPVYNLNAGLLPAGSNDIGASYATSLYSPNTGGTFNRILRIGGMRITNTLQASHSDMVEVCDSLAPGSQWTTGGIPPMWDNRMHANVVIMPGGELFAVGGITEIASTDPANPLPTFEANFSPELLINNSFWTGLPPQTGPRHYHSCALLLPNGQVLLCGGEAFGSGRPPDYQLFNPPYITLNMPRPNNVVVTTTGGTPIGQNTVGGLAYGGTFRVAWNPNSVTGGAVVDRVVLMSPTSLTHHDGGGQRCIILPSQPFPVDATVTSSRDFTVFNNPFQVPSGWYMLFVVTNQGAPSDLAWWVHVA